MKFFGIPAVLLSLSLCCSTDGGAQAIAPVHAPMDSAFIENHITDFIGRLYGSDKFTRLGMGKTGESQRAQYRPNNNYNIGFGFNYRWLGVNIGFKTPGINNDDDKYGKTKYLDLQSYVYLRRWVVNFYAQSYQGYYQGRKGQIQLPGRDVPAGIRNDLYTRDLGLDGEYLFNGRRFSYRAVYLQNERQLKSAGSLIAGAGIRYVHTQADSGLIPYGPEYASIAGPFSYNRSAVASFNLKGGYAYTLVIRKSLFLMGSLAAGAGLSHARVMEPSTGREASGFGLALNAIAHLGAGYNSNRYFFGVYYTTQVLQNPLPYAHGWQQYETGVLRVAVARRWVLSKNTAHKLDRILPGKE